VTVPALQLADVCESCRQCPGTRWILGGDGESPFLVCQGCAPTPLSASVPPSPSTVPPAVPAGRRPTNQTARAVAIQAAGISTVGVSLWALTRIAGGGTLLVLGAEASVLCLGYAARAFGGAR